MEQAEETVTVGYQPPAPCFSSQHLFHWRQCTQCPWLLSTLEFGYRLQFKLECLRLGEEGPFISLLPNPSFLPKVLLRSFVSRPLVLKHFHPPPHNSAESARLHLICPVRALRRYISCTQQIRHSNQLFVCYGDSVQGQVVSKQRLVKWVVRLIELAYHSAGMTRPQGVVAHSTRGVSASWALFRGASLEDVCSSWLVIIYDICQILSSRCCYDSCIDCPANSRTSMIRLM